ncbi:MAG: NAD(P)-dependent oxidoreductase [Eubacteriales bacterium]|jgi:glyoxylate reductase
MKPKILLGQWVPEECVAPYRNAYDFCFPDAEKIAFSYEEVLEQIDQYDAYLVIANKGDREVIQRGTRLKAIANFGVGYDNIDWKYATEVGLPVINAPTTVTEATAEHAVALIMSVMRGVARHDREIRRGEWKSPLFSDMDLELHGRVLGIMGFGRIGKMVCRKAQGLGMKVVYYDTFRATPEVEKEYGVTYLPFDEVLAQSDCITLHMPFTQENYHLFNLDTLRKMKPTAYLVNAARGPILCEKDLAKALREGIIKGAALDVVEQEPKPDPELLELDNVTLTPHIASCTMKTRMAMCVEALQGLMAVIEGRQPYNTVNPSVYKK